MKKIEIGTRYGALTVIADVMGPTVRSGRTYRCRCDCGAEVEDSTARLYRRKHCGGAEHHREPVWRRGLRAPPEYSTWQAMQNRCYNRNDRNYANYGGRGIVVCDRWRGSFAAFLADMGPRPGPGFSIDRKENDGNYEPGNCRWATPRQQARNMRKTLWIEYQGRRVKLMDLADELGVAPRLLRTRVLRFGWSVERAITEPVRAMTNWDKILGTED